MDWLGNVPRSSVRNPREGSKFGSRRMASTASSGDRRSEEVVGGSGTRQQRRPESRVAQMSGRM